MQLSTSLLSVLSKVLECHVFCLLSEYLEDKNIISDCQWGFTPKRSTTTALLTLTHMHMEAGYEICAVILDIKKAFDSVPHRYLLYVVKDTGLHPVLLKWICSYLTNRSQRVVVDGTASSEVHTVSVVPQGSVLGPLLFLMYINSVTYLQLSQGSKLILYADDIVLYKPIKTYSDYQSELDLFQAWSDRNRLVFNLKKCKFMIITRKKIKLLEPLNNIMLGTSPTERTYSFKYFGVTISSTLSWSGHIHNICTKARKVIGILYRHFHLNADTTSLLQLCLSPVRPILDYASQVWHPPKYIKKLESVQKFALRLCTKQWNLDYESLLMICNILTLSAIEGSSSVFAQCLKLYTS